MIVIIVFNMIIIFTSGIIIINSLLLLLLLILLLLLLLLLFLCIWIYCYYDYHSVIFDGLACAAAGCAIVADQAAADLAYYFHYHYHYHIFEFIVIVIITMPFLMGWAGIGFSHQFSWLPHLKKNLLSPSHVAARHSRRYKTRKNTEFVFGWLHEM